MGVIDRKSRLFERIVRLRRAERAHPEDADVVAVRADLEEELGSVSRALAARLLGVSHTALRRWVDAGDLPTVVAPDGHVRVPIGPLVELYERLRVERASGARRLHVLEPALLEARRKADALDLRSLVDPRPEPRHHDRAARRSLVYHRVVARRLRKAMVDEARHRVWEWRDSGRLHPRWAEAWEEVLERPIPEIKRVISADTRDAADLRQSSPFAGMLSEAERRRIFEEIR